jgi:hypothetical protein
MTVEQLAWEYLDKANAQAARNGRNPLSLALKQCHGQQEIDAVLRCHAEDTAIPNAGRYVVAWDDDNQVETDRQTLTAMVLSGLVGFMTVVGNSVVVEPGLGLERSVAMAM